MYRSLCIMKSHRYFTYSATPALISPGFFLRMADKLIVLRRSFGKTTKDQLENKWYMYDTFHERYLSLLAQKPRFEYQLFIVFCILIYQLHVLTETYREARVISVVKEQYLTI